ncbi:MAG: CHAT domain-containing protein [Chloroflexi bacterium]|nr:CHAT domain-containing protein [Chloroflexota bacterium]
MIIGSMGPREEYRTLEIRVFAPFAAGGGYPIELDVPGAPRFAGTLQLDRTKLLALDRDPAAYGQLLGRAVFADDALVDGYRQLMAVVQSGGGGLRVHLRLDTPELEALRWERLYHPLNSGWQPLGVTAITPFSRWVPIRDWKRPLPVTERPLRMLAVVASPSDLDAYNLDAIAAAESDALRRTLDGLPDVAVTYLATGTSAPPTLNNIRAALASGYHIVHWVCHGAVTPAGRFLYLEGDGGETDPVEAARLVSSLKALSDPPLLCSLAACESGSRGRQDSHTPLGAALVEEGGVHAAVAMADRVGVDTARLFMEQFYSRLLKHGVVDLAVNEARALVQDTWDWGVPVLFSRLPDNQLLDFPIGRFYSGYLTHADRAFYAAGEALASARAEEHGEQLVRDLERLIKELSKSHKVLVDVASQFRRVGRDPDTFADKFETFYYDFTEYYNGEDWVDEDTSCREIWTLAAKVMPRLAPLMDPATFQQLGQELDLLGNADANLIRQFQTYLDEMNAAVEGIWERLGNGDLDGAIQAKRDFEAQITPSFQRSKEMLSQMSGSITAVAAA